MFKQNNYLLMVDYHFIFILLNYIINSLKYTYILLKLAIDNTQ